MTEWAERIGADTTKVIEAIFASVPVDDQGINPGLAVLRLSSRYSPQRLETAARIALAAGIASPRYAHLHPILAGRQDQPGRDDQTPPHRRDDEDAVGFVRRAAYYAKGDQ